MVIVHLSGMLQLYSLYIVHCSLLAPVDVVLDDFEFLSGLTFV